MPAAALPTVIPLPTTEALPRKRFTREEVERMMDTDIFAGQRFELIDGDLIDKMGQKPPHSYTIQLVAKWLYTVFGIDAIRIQSSIEASGTDRERSVPEPDVAVLVERLSDYRRRHPRGDELLLAVEVADTTRSLDLSRKVELYAAAGVPEYWVVDLPKRMLVIHRQPDGQQYRDIHMFAEDENVSLEGREEQVRVGDLLPDRD